MIVAGRNTFKGLDCPANTYGGSGRMYGWSAAPCKPCPRGMITDGVSGATNSDACINPGGFGYASEGEQTQMPEPCQCSVSPAKSCWRHKHIKG
jgi:hypothetical protein